jgi:rhomboid protease GluP
LTQPKGVLDYAQLRAQQRLAQTITTRHAHATNALLAVIGVLFVIELITGAMGNIRRMLMLGANASELVRYGQWWRLVTAGFLHNSIEHFALNALALLSVGTILEKLLGQWRFIIIALSSSVGGNIASMLMSTHRYSVGASSCIFGLLGALLVVQRARLTTLPPALVLPPKRWAYVLGINGLISLLPGIDLSAHVGGFITGAALAALFLRNFDVRAPSEGFAMRVLAVALIAIFVLSFALAFGIAFKA